MKMMPQRLFVLHLRFQGVAQFTQTLYQSLSNICFLFFYAIELEALVIQDFTTVLTLTKQTSHNKVVFSVHTVKD